MIDFGFPKASLENDKTFWFCCDPYFSWCFVVMFIWHLVLCVPSTFILVDRPTNWDIIGTFIIYIFYFQFKFVLFWAFFVVLEPRVTFSWSHLGDLKIEKKIFYFQKEKWNLKNLCLFMNTNWGCFPISVSNFMKWK